MDPLFLYFSGDLPSDYVVADVISDLALNPVVRKTIEFDSFSQGFNSGGVILANLDSIFNFSDTPKELLRYVPYSGKIFLDLSLSERGGSEYWIYRNRINRVITAKTIKIENFRSDVDKESVYQVDFDNEKYDKERVVKWGKYANNVPGLIGTTDIPRGFDDFLLKLQTIFLLSSPNAWFFLPLPNDRAVEGILKELQPSMFRLTVIRIVSSPLPWLVGRFKNTPTLDISKTPSLGKTTGSFENPLSSEFNDFKQASIIWKIPYSFPNQMVPM